MSTANLRPCNPRGPSISPTEKTQRQHMRDIYAAADRGDMLAKVGIVLIGRVERHLKTIGGAHG